MTAGADATCPQCGRALPAEHALCVKCGWRRDARADTSAASDRTSRQVWLAVGLGVALVVGLIAAVLLLWPEREPSTRRDPAAGDRTAASPEDPDRAWSRRPMIAPATRPKPRPRVTPSTPPGPMPPAPPPLAPRPTPRADSLIDRVRACVDRERREAEKDCETTRRWLGHTAESVCLIAQVGAAYYRCLKSEAKNLGKCVVRCSGVAKRCALACAAGDRHKHAGGTAGCLWQCWRTDIDPCLGKCIRP